MEPWTILFVDDDPEDRMIIQDALQMIKPDVMVSFAENGEQALAALDSAFNTRTLPCLVVLDLNMPKMNGTETLRNIKKNESYNSISVVIYSTSISHLEKEKCMKLGAKAYISKPISFKESKATATQLLELCEGKAVS